MKRLPVALAAFSMLLLSACSEPVPTAQQHYVGTWEGENMAMVIRPNGTLSYSRKDGDLETSVNGPIKAFDGNDIVVGFGWFTTTFEVSVPPRIENGDWTMVVDDVRLRRTGTFEMPEGPEQNNNEPVDI